MNSGLSMKVMDWNAAQGTFVGMASTFGNLDRVDDIVERGAYAKTLAQARETKARTGGRYLWPLLWLHQPEEPIGGVLEATEDARGLKITGQLDLDSTRGRDVFAGIKAGYIDSLSIGYTVVRATRDKQGIRHLLEVALTEISLITANFPANVEARIEMASVKSVDDTAIERMIAMKREVQDWRNQRPMLSGGGAPARAPYEETDDDRAPSRLSYITERQYAEAVDDWLARRNSQAALAQEQERRQAAFQKSITVARDQRVCRGLATLAEQRAYAEAYGHLPDGRVYRDESERVRRAYDAIYAKLDAGDD